MGALLGAWRRCATRAKHSPQCHRSRFLNVWPHQGDHTTTSLPARVGRWGLRQRRHRMRGLLARHAPTPPAALTFVASDGHRRACRQLGQHGQLLACRLCGALESVARAVPGAGAAQRTQQRTCQQASKQAQERTRPHIKLHIVPRLQVHAAHTQQPGALLGLVLCAWAESKRARLAGAGCSTCRWQAQRHGAAAAGGRQARQAGGRGRRPVGGAAERHLLPLLFLFGRILGIHRLHVMPGKQGASFMPTMRQLAVQLKEAHGPLLAQQQLGRQQTSPVAQQEGSWPR